MPDTAVLEQLQESVTETGTALKAISDRFDKADKSLTDLDGRTKVADEAYKKAAADLGVIQKNLDKHIEDTRAALKALPSGVHGGGRDRIPISYNTRANGSGFQFTDLDACKAFGLWIMSGCCPKQETRDTAMKALDKHQHDGIWFSQALEHASHKAVASGTNDFSQVGAMVPEVLLADIIRNVELMGHFQVNAGRVPMAAPTVTIPKSLTELTVYYPDENVAITESEPTVGDLTFNTRLYATLSKWSNTLDEDCIINFASFMAELMAYAHAKAVDTNGFLGDGTSTYARTIGIKNATAVKTHILGNAVGASATDTGKDTFGELAYKDLVAAQSLIPTKARAGAKWYAHRYVAGIMRSLVDSNGLPLFSTDYVNGKRVNRILGDELVEVDVLPSATAVTTKFIGYGDLRLSMGYGERRGLRIDNSKEAGFAADQTWVRSTARRAIGPLDAQNFCWLVTSTT